MKLHEITKIQSRLGNRDIQLDKEIYDDLNKSLGDYKGIDIRWDRFRDQLIIIGNQKKHDKLVFSIYLTRTKTGWYVDSTKIAPKFQGFGIMPDIYAYILHNMPDKFLLRAGGTQTEGGQYIWKKLAQRDDVIVFTKLPGNPVVELEYDSDSNELDAPELEHGVYDKDHTTMYAMSRSKLYR